MIKSNQCNIECQTQQAYLKDCRNLNKKAIILIKSSQKKQKRKDKLHLVKKEKDKKWKCNNKILN